MITYSKIGHFGRLGNQLFQFAGVLGIARKLEYDIKFPIENMTEYQLEDFQDGITRECTFDIPKAFVLDESILDTKVNILSQIKYEVNEPHFHFNPEYFTVPDGCDFKGYFQAEKYFKHIEDELKQLLKFKPHIQEIANSLLPKTTNELVSIHLRRGDYVGLENFHPVCSPEYYNIASQEFTDKDYNFVIFSDDIKYCKKFFGEQENISYIDNVDPYIDLCLMSMCDHNIIANSSFSWWGAWLNNNTNKRVIAPKQWFGPGYQHTHDTKDLYCEGWKII
jgi:hypothetical protein